VHVFEEHRWQGQNNLSAEQVIYFRAILASHRIDPSSGACLICMVPSCQDWRYAYDQLAVAGQLMAEPEGQLGRNRMPSDGRR
jgi:hypothetical protein